MNTLEIILTIQTIVFAFLVAVVVVALYFVIQLINVTKRVMLKIETTAIQIETAADGVNRFKNTIASNFWGVLASFLRRR